MVWKKLFIQIIIIGIGMLSVSIWPSILEASSRSGGYGRSSGGYDYGYRTSSKSRVSSITYPAAIKKIDPVAYFTKGQRIKGKSDIYYLWKGQKWFFSSKAHEKMFVANPDKYKPQYDGYCAYAISQGSLAAGNPKHWTIVNDKLYFNVSGSVKKKWEADKENFIQLADQAWPSLKQ